MPPPAVARRVRQDDREALERALTFIVRGPDFPPEAARLGEPVGTAPGLRAPETLSRIRTARGLRETVGDHLSPVQLELFLEAGVRVASQAARARASQEQVDAILRRATEQAGKLLTSATNAMPVE